MIDFANVPPGTKILELGGGDNPHPQSTINVDVREGPKVNFVVDFNGPLPIKSLEWDVVFCQYALEHVSWRSIPGFLSEVLRVLKLGGRAIFVTSNTEAQIQYIKAHPDGWDGKGPFESFSCVLFGDMDYPENSHRSYFSPQIIEGLFKEAGFERVVVRSYGLVETDMVVQAVKPNILGTNVDRGITKEVEENHPVTVLTPVTDVAGKVEIVPKSRSEEVKPETKTPLLSREEMFDKHYFNGGGKVGGYAREGMWDFPVHHITARHVLARRPESVLEIGCARGYILKRLQDAGVQAAGLEISKHCHMTRACDNIRLWDLCRTPWDWNGYQYDLCFSIATLEHVPEEFIPAVIGEMKRTCKRGLHGIDFGENDDGFDQTHTTLRPKSWWIDQFRKHAPGWPVEIVDKEDLEKGEFPPEILAGDGKVKLNIGSFTTMSHYGWVNIDQHDLGAWAQQNHYRFLRADVRQGLPFLTGTVDLIMACHFLEHLTYREGLAFLRDCRRMLKPTGALRIVVPDSLLLIEKHVSEYLDDYKEISDVESYPTSLMKLWSIMIGEEHKALYDEETLEHQLKEAGFLTHRARFRNGHPSAEQIRKETTDMMPVISCFMDCTPRLH